MDLTVQRRRGDEFRALHTSGLPLLLVNAWDAVSARLIERAGVRAIATTSAGIAWALGYQDGERIPRSEMLAMVKRIADAVSVPVTADLEAGYGATTREVADTTRLAIAAGAVGMNLEDAMGDDESDDANVLYPPAVAAERVAAAREAADGTGVPFVVNARTDVFLRAVGAPETRLRHAIDRANAYRAAGADSLFVPGVRDADAIATLAREIDGPLNILAVPGTPALPELARLGVARVSVGSGAMRATLAAVARATNELLESGRFEAILGSAIPFAEIEALMAR